MKTGTILLAVAALQATSASFGANITLQGTEAQTSFDITNPASWGVEAIGSEDYATITTNGDIETSAYISSNQTFQVLILDLQNNAHLRASGTNSTIKNILGEEPNRNNTNIGTNSGSSVSVEILGSGNTYAIDVTARSLMLGNADSVSGANSIYVSSNDSGSRNTFSVSGVNSFIRLNKSADSSASNSIRIGDYTDATFAVSAKVGGSESFDLAGGKASIEMLGNNSTLTLKNDSFIGNENNNGTQSGGTAKILVSGSGNTFNSVGTTVWMNKTMTGGSNSFEISGENNTVTWQNIQVGSASSTGGSAKISVEGSTHSIRATDQLGVYGSEVTDASGSVEAVNGGTVEFIADEFGVSAINVSRVVAFDGILSLDVSGVSLEKGEYMEFALIVANSDWSSIAEKLISTSEEGNAHLDIKTKSGDDTWEIIYNGNSLYFAYTYVPEPSTYAVLFGIGALVLALSLRRKR